MSCSSSYSLGLFFILCVSLIWSAASILVQFLYTQQSFDSPFLLTYIGVSLFTLLLPTKFAVEQCKVLWHKSLGLELEIVAHYENVPSVEDEEAPTNQAPTPVEILPTKWTNADHMRAAMKIAPVWFLANWTYNASLAYTSITSSTVLASTGSVFTFLFAVLYRDEQFTCLKCLGVLFGVTGSLFTALHDASSNSDDSDVGVEEHNPTVRLLRHLVAMPVASDNATWWTQERALFGDVLGLVSAIGYGGYAVMVRVMCPRDESLMSMELLLGYIGLFNMVALSPILFYQLFQGNHSELTLVVFGFLVVKGLLDNVLSDYLWARSVVLTSATVATVGLGLTIPLAFLSDVFWMGQEGDQVVSLSSVLGALSVLAGFVLVNLSTDHEANSIDESANDEPSEENDNHHPVQLTEMKPYREQEEHSHDR